MQKRATVVVLGQLARSPRMQYHCLSLADNDYQVTVIGYDGLKCCEKLEGNVNIKQRLMREAPNFKNFMPTLFAYVFKTIWQSFMLMFLLLTSRRPKIVLVQNPPCVPTFPVVWFYCLLSGANFVIDWHNYGHTLLSLNLNSEKHPLVRLSRWCERFFGNTSKFNFCVTQSMKQDLQENWGLLSESIQVLMDKPPKIYQPMRYDDKMKFLQEIMPELKRYWATNLPRVNFNFSKFEGDKTENEWQRTRPVIIISSTSWTDDEDFDLLLNALRMYDEQQTNNNQRTTDTKTSDSISDLKVRNKRNVKYLGSRELPRIICVITGKGPLKRYYQQRIERINFSDRIHITLPWLSMENYARMVAASDFGISLHTSSSGHDLPMKVVDMFGCQIPVLAYRYKCINELVKEGEYGFLFESELDLNHKILILLNDFVQNNKIIDSDSSPTRSSTKSLLQQFRNNIRDCFLVDRWEDNWNNKARPHLDKFFQ